MKGNISTFVFNEINLNQVVYIDGVPHPTRSAIGEFLEYADPQKAVDKILERNPHIQAWSVPVKLTGTDGKNYDTFVYHPIGFLLIVMESGQPRAHEMKQAVAEFVWRYAGPRNMSFKEETELLKLRRVILADLGKNRDAFVQQALIADLQRISLTIGLPVPDLKFLGTDSKQLVLGDI